MWDRSKQQIVSYKSRRVQAEVEYQGESDRFSNNKKCQCQSGNGIKSSSRSILYIQLDREREQIIRYALILQWFKRVYIMIRVQAGSLTGSAIPA